jgi:hypothetical protein
MVRETKGRAMIRKASAVVGTLLLLAGVAHAHIYVRFTTGSGTIFDHNDDPIAAQQTFAAYYSPDDSNSGFDPADPLNPTGGDELLGVYDSTRGSATLTGRIFQDSQEYGAGATGYADFIYIAVFELAWATYQSNGNVIPELTHYGLSDAGGSSASEKLTEQHPPPLGTPDQYGSQITSLTTSLQTVPEPGSLALMALGLGVVAVKRLRKRQ